MKSRKQSSLLIRMGRTLRVFFIALLSSATLSVYAQSTGTVNGTVSDERGDQIVGASVVVKGTTKGVTTDVNGQFTLTGVASDAVLQIRFVGYKPAEVPVAGKRTLSIVLEEDAEALEEVEVVVGYGVQKKSDVTGALAHVGAEELNMKPVSNAFEALQGKVAGVDITSSMRPGTTGSIRIRGNRSLTASNDPLYVVDGVPLSSGGIETINPRDIESIDILKDASSTAIYGSRGANGVVLVTTKRGKAGTMQLNYSGSVTLENIEDLSPAMTASDYITWRRWAYYNSNPTVNPRGDQPDYEKDQSYFAASGDPAALANVNKGWVNGVWDGSKVVDTDWTKFVTRTGITNEHTVSASGGNENLQGFVSVGYLNQLGTQMGQSYERFNFSTAVDIQAKPWFKMGGSINSSWAIQEYGYSRTGQSSGSGPTDLYNAAKAIPRFGVPYDEAGELVLQPCGTTTLVYTVMDEWNKSIDNRQNFRALGSFYGQVDFGKIWQPLEGLTYKISFGPDFRHYRQGIFISEESAVKMGSKNQASYSNTRYLSWTLDNQINYNKKIDKHQIGITLLQSASKFNRENAQEGASAIPNENFLWYNMGSVDITDAAKYGASMGTGMSENQLASYMARINYSFNDRYLLTVSGRQDGASVLAEGHKWSFFPSAALGWRIDQEDFMAADWVNQLKLRVGMGTTGNSAVGAYSTLGTIRSFYVPFGAEVLPAYATNEPYYFADRVGMANKELTWEKTTQYNYGIDFAFLDRRISGSLDVYNSQTNDLLLNMSIPTLTGFASTLANVGKTKNFGVDLSLNVVPVKTSNFEWISILNGSFQKDEIVELANGKEDDIANAWFIGQPLAVHYGIACDGLWQPEDAEEMAKYNANGHNFQVGMVKPVEQGEKDYKIDADDRTILGNRNPNWLMGWTNIFNYKGIELSVELNGRFGYMISTGGEGQLGMYQQREIDYWTPENLHADYQKPIYSTAGGDAYSSLLGFKNASFIKLRNLSLGYNFDRKALKNVGINSLKLYAQAKNLGNIYSSVDFMDLDLGSTFYNRGFTFGLQIGF